MNYKYISPHSVNFVIDKNKTLFIYINGCFICKKDNVNKQGRELDCYIREILHDEYLYIINGQLQVAALAWFIEEVAKINDKIIKQLGQINTGEIFCDLYKLIQENTDLAKEYYDNHKN